MKRSIRFALVTIAASLAAASWTAAAELTPHRAQYKVRISVVSGKLDTELRATGDGYVARHIIEAAGLSRMLTRGRMDVTSEFRPEADGIKPVSYRSVDTIRKDPEQHIRFDWTSNEARGTVGGEEIRVQLEGVAHDAVSIQYELMRDLLNGGPDDTYVLFDLDKLTVTKVSAAGTKTVRTKAGDYETIGVRHQKEGSSRITTLWCAPALDYLPVVIEQHRKGKLNFRATLTSYVPT
ncbi:MAG: DUF3108 domain-containing protein [Proteobacteria bacterium]|nr:DUF3108 domain-containing protein [Pseudomonadota bacterium]